MTQVDKFIHPLESIGGDGEDLDEGIKVDLSVDQRPRVNGHRLVEILGIGRGDDVRVLESEVLEQDLVQFLCVLQDVLEDVLTGLVRTVEILIVGEDEFLEEVILEGGDLARLEEVGGGDEEVFARVFEGSATVWGSAGESWRGSESARHHSRYPCGEIEV